MTRDQRGQALIELALVLPILVILVVGLFDLGRAALTANTLAEAAKEGVRFAAVHGALSTSPTGPGATSYTAPSTDTQVTAAVSRAVVGVPSLTVSSTWTDGNAYRGSRVAVTVSTAFTPILSSAFIGQSLFITITSGSSGVIEQ